MKVLSVLLIAAVAACVVVLLPLPAVGGSLGEGLQFGRAPEANLPGAWRPAPVERGGACRPVAG